MKKSKRLLALLLALTMTAALAGCTPDDSNEPSTDPVNQQQTNDATLPPGETGGAALSESETGTQPGESTQGVFGPQGSSATQTREKPTEEKTTKPKPADDPTKMSKAELISYYNTAANDAKKNAKSITKTQNQASLKKAPEVNSSLLEGVANTLMKQFLSDNPKAVNETYTSAAEKNANFPVAGKTYASQLAAGDVASASCTKSGGNYLVTLKVKGASVAKAFSTVTKDQILDAVSAVSGIVKFNKIEITNADSTIRATIGANGKLQKAQYDLPSVSMNLSIAMFGGIDASLGIHLADWFTINW